jgi:hypothetical protein
MAKAPLSIVVVRGADGAGSFYEDAGDGYGHLRGDYRLVNITQRGNEIKLSYAGDYSSARRVATLELLGVTAAPRGVAASRDIELNPEKFDRATGRVVVPITIPNPTLIDIAP